MRKRDYLEKGYKIIVLLLAIIIAICAVRIISINRNYKDSLELNKNINKKYLEIIYDEPENSSDDIEEFDKEPKNIWKSCYNVNFEELVQENSDIIAWIIFENEEISYPILYSGDNDYYLRRDINKEYSIAGSIFIDGRNTKLEDNYTIVYGHNMRNESMFGKLKYYYKDENYFQNHQYFQILTPSYAKRYRIFGKRY